MAGLFGVGGGIVKVLSYPVLHIVRDKNARKPGLSLCVTRVVRKVILLVM